jgi:hypothetical protein
MCLLQKKNTAAKPAAPDAVQGPKKKLHFFLFTSFVICAPRLILTHDHTNQMELGGECVTYGPEQKFAQVLVGKK